MIKADEDALLCDFVETYHTYGYKGLPLQMAASLAVGLRDDSRIKMKLSGAKTTSDILMLAAIVDRLGLLVWAQTKDAEKGRNRPKSIIKEMFETKDSNVSAYNSGKDYQRERAKLLGLTEG